MFFLVTHVDCCDETPGGCHKTYSNVANKMARTSILTALDVCCTNIRIFSASISREIEHFKRYVKIEIERPDGVLTFH
jgi:hypothetical protein